MGLHNVSAVNITDDVLVFYESIPICPSSGHMSFGRWKFFRSASQTNNGNHQSSGMRIIFLGRLAFYLGRFPDRPKLRLG